MFTMFTLITSWLPYHVRVIVGAVFAIFVGFAIFRLISYILDLIPFV